MHVLARFLVAVAVIGLTAAGTFWTLDRTVGAQDTDDTQPVYTLDESLLSGQMQTLLDENADLDISISVIDLQTGKPYHFGETNSYTAASVAKLLTASLFLHLVELGKANMNDTIGADTASVQMEKMIVKSDNDAWHAFNEYLTQPALQQYAQKLGLESYVAHSNVIDSDDIARLLAALAEGRLLNNANTNQLLSLMERADMRNFIVAGVPDGVTTYHKVGYLSDRLHDASLVKKGDRAYVLVIFSKSQGSYSFGRGASLFQDITGRVSDIFFTPGTTDTSPSSQN